MRTVTSKDGEFASVFDQSGEGPAIILVVGAFNDRRWGRRWPNPSNSNFTVFNYDRRGRGDSGDTAPYAIERVRSKTLTRRSPKVVDRCTYSDIRQVRSSP